MKPKNIIEAIARSVIVRNYFRDKEFIKLQKDSIELQLFKRENVCILCKDILGPRDDVYYCENCDQACCVACDNIHNHLIEIPQGMYCTPCVSDKCQICHDNNRDYECNICPKSMCDDCVITKHCTCGKSNIYCSNTCTGLFIEPLKCWICRRPCCSHNEHTWHYEEGVPICKDKNKCTSI